MSESDIREGDLRDILRKKPTDKKFSSTMMIDKKGNKVLYKYVNGKPIITSIVKK